MLRYRVCCIFLRPNSKHSVQQQKSPQLALCLIDKWPWNGHKRRSDSKCGFEPRPMRNSQSRTVKIGLGKIPERVPRASKEGPGHAARRSCCPKGPLAWWQGRYGHSVVYHCLSKQEFFNPNVICFNRIICLSHFPQKNPVFSFQILILSCDLMSY